jgi:hypothetical protein
MDEMTKEILNLRDRIAESDLQQNQRLTRIETVLENFIKNQERMENFLDEIRLLVERVDHLSEKVAENKNQSIGVKQLIAGLIVTLTIAILQARLF